LSGGRHLWMGETSSAMNPYDPSIANALVMANNIHQFMVVANVSSYGWWELAYQATGPGYYGATAPSGITTTLTPHAGKQSAVMCVSFSLRASLAMSGAAGGNDRRCCTGPTTVASCEKAENSQVEHRVCIEIRCYLAPQPIWASSKPSNRRPALAPARVSSRCG
jgi:hypothetical protein